MRPIALLKRDPDCRPTSTPHAGGPAWRQLQLQLRPEEENLQGDIPVAVRGGGSARNDSAQGPELSGAARAADEFDVQVNP